MKKATKVAVIESGRGDVGLYHLEPSHDGVEWVVVSAKDVPYSGPETYIFAANESGDVTDWVEMEGSFRGAFDHARALNGLGYEVAP